MDKQVIDKQYVECYGKSLERYKINQDRMIVNSAGKTYKHTYLKYDLMECDAVYKMKSLQAAMNEYGKYDDDDDGRCG